MKVVSKLVNRKKFWESHFAIQATKFVVWDVVAFRPCSDCAGRKMVVLARRCKALFFLVDADGFVCLW